MATDIAIAVGVLSLLGTRVPPSLKLFLLALAIVDDIGAIVVIAIFYSRGSRARLAASSRSRCSSSLVVVIRARRTPACGPYVVVGVALWLAVHESGVHATITGVVLGLLAADRPPRAGRHVDVDALADVSTVEAAQETVVIARESVSVVEWLEHLLHPWTSFVIVPLFALANAGVLVTSRSAVERGCRRRSPTASSSGSWSASSSASPASAWLALRLGVGAAARRHVGRRDLVGVAALGGIGFTVSLFVTGLAFARPARERGQDRDPRRLDRRRGVGRASILASPSRHRERPV